MSQHGEAISPTLDKHVTVLGFGSLLSKKSSRLTFPNLMNFRQGRVPNYRRVFAHPASIFFQRGIACMDTLQIASLSAEYSSGSSFICSVFEVPSKGIWESDSFNTAAPSQAFLEREEEFNIRSVTYYELNEEEEKSGILCVRSTDEEYLKRWGYQRFHDNYKHFEVTTIWGWGYDSGIRPCAVYLRHCLIAAKSVSEECLNSFLDETFLVDRKTTLRDYVEKYPEVWNYLPPDELAERYGG